MQRIISNLGMSVVTTDSPNLSNRLKHERPLVPFSFHCYMYLHEAINRELRKFGFELVSIDSVYFQASVEGKTMLFAITRNNNNYTLFGETKHGVNLFFKNGVYSGKGLVYGFDRMNKESIDLSFNKGELSFLNNYCAQLYGLHELEKTISTNRQDIIHKIASESIHEKAAEALLELKDIADGKDHYEKYLISLYVMSVFSFIEHAAILILPFWFVNKNTSPYYWKKFCDGFHPAGFDTFRDFWTSRDRDWISSFIETLCCFTRFDYRNPHGQFDFSLATEDDKTMKYLYDQLRSDYRNPIHHGMSTGENRTGLSLEVPSLKKTVLFNSVPLLREIDEKAFSDTKLFLKLFVKSLKMKNPDIVKYLETGWSVPVDCSELCIYMSEGCLDSFISEYQFLLSKLD